MLFKRKNKLTTLRYFFNNFSAVVGLVLIWRGIWYILDALDKAIFEGGHGWTAAIGVILGLVILYLPDKNLKEIERL